MSAWRETRRPLERLAPMHARMQWDLILLWSSVIGVLVVVFREDLLPERFFYDGEHIQQIALGLSSGFGDQSYVRVADAYRLAGLAHSATAAGLVGLLVAVGGIFVASRMTGSPPSAMSIALTPVAVIVAAIYLGFYSKDVFLVPIAVMSAFRSRRIQADVVLVLAMLSYAYFFRSYWVIIAAMYIVLRIVLSRPRRQVLTLLAMVLGLVIVSTYIWVVLGVDPDHFRSVVNDARSNSNDAASAIRGVIPGAGFVPGMLNVVLTLPLLIVPIPLLSAGGAYHVGLFIGFVLLWGAFAAGARAQVRESFPAYRAIALVLSILSVQAVFEPDYGSVLRHLSPFLLIWIVLFWNRRPTNQTFGVQRGH